MYVVTDALAKSGLAEVLLEHADYCRALLVGEYVEHRLCLGGRENLELDRTSRCKAVDIERGCPRETEVGPPLPIGPVGIGGFHLHEGRERFVEPDRSAERRVGTE